MRRKGRRTKARGGGDEDEVEEGRNNDAKDGLAETAPVAFDRFRRIKVMVAKPFSHCVALHMGFELCIPNG